MSALAAAAPTPCQQAGRHLSERVMGQWVVCAACGETWQNPNWRGRIAATVAALVEAAPPLSGEQLDNLRRLIPHTA